MHTMTQTMAINKASEYTVKMSGHLFTIMIVSYVLTCQYIFEEIGRILFVSEYAAIITSYFATYLMYVNCGKIFHSDIMLDVLGPFTDCAFDNIRRTVCAKDNDDSESDDSDSDTQSATSETLDEESDIPSKDTSEESADDASECDCDCDHHESEEMNEAIPRKLLASDDPNNIRMIQKIMKEVAWPQSEIHPTTD